MTAGILDGRSASKALKEEVAGAVRAFCEATGSKPGLAAIIAGDDHADHGGLVVDGFVLNAESRNKYSAKKILPKGCYKGTLFQTRSKDIKLLNSILLNPYGTGIYIGSRGKGNEIRNNFIINTFYAGISTRSAQPDSITKIKNNTIAFGWFQPGKGGHQAVPRVGRWWCGLWPQTPGLQLQDPEKTQAPGL